MDLKHIAIIMDGNRRWAKARNLDKKLGHKQGADTLKKITKYANEIGLKYLTVYAFSTENWKREDDEVNALMLLFQTYLDDFAKKVDTKNIRIKFIGDITRLNSNLQKSIRNAEEKTKDNTGLTLCLAINYGGRDELVKATQKIASLVKEGKIKVEDINEETIENNIYTAGIPDPDLIIRTSGEMRLSGFLTWQSVYSEFLFVQKHWPDFSEEDLDMAIEEYSKRHRKFGAN